MQVEIIRGDKSNPESSIFKRTKVNENWTIVGDSKNKSIDCFSELNTINCIKTPDIGRFIGEDEKFILISSSGFSTLISRVLKINANFILDVNEHIDFFGDVIVDLRESEINKTLRKLYQKKPEIIFLCLLNSSINPIHEKSLRNIIATSGYKNIITSYENV